MRGARGRMNISMELDGIIPADAGSTTGTIIVSSFDEDHPRGCGEHACCR